VQDKQTLPATASLIQATDGHSWPFAKSCSLSTVHHKRGLRQTKLEHIEMTATPLSGTKQETAESQYLYTSLNIVVL